MTERRGPAESLRPSTRSLRSLAQDQKLCCPPTTSVILSKRRQARAEGRTISMWEFCETNPIRSFRVRICHRTLRAFENQIVQIKANSMNGINDRGLGKANSNPIPSQFRSGRAYPLPEVPRISG